MRHGNAGTCRKLVRLGGTSTTTTTSCSLELHVQILCMLRCPKAGREEEGGELLLDTASQVAEQVETEDVIVS